jgi:HEAT repeat protein
MKRLIPLAAVFTAVLAAVPAFGQQPPQDLPPIIKPKFSEPLRPIPAVPSRKNVPLDAALRAKAHDAVEKAFTNADMYIRSNAVEAAQHTFAPADAKALALKALSDDAPVVRFAGCIACGDLGYVEAHDNLYKMAYDKDPNVRLAARYGLHKLGDRSLTQEMLLGLNDERSGVRGNTVMLLGMLGEKSAIPPLRRRYTDGSPLVRMQVAEALWKLSGDRESMEHVLSGTVSPYGSEQVAALLAIVSTHDTSVGGNVASFLRSETPEVAITAARCLGTLGSDEGLGVVYKYIESPDSRQRSMCAQAFGEIARSDTQEALQKLLADTAPDVQLAAATAILKLKTPTTATANGQ